VLWLPPTQHVACYAGQSETVAYLLGCGFSLEERDADQRTPLHYATRKGHTHVVRLLIEKGCEVDRLDGNQRSALVYAALSNNHLMMQCLLEGGADADVSASARRHPWLHRLDPE
jgi:ankyrin repeat protein